MLQESINKKLKAQEIMNKTHTVQKYTNKTMPKSKINANRTGHRRHHPR